jgi:CBS domain containing-hemolysin-like protein
MLELISDSFNLFIILFLVTLNGFFVAVEFSMVRSHITKLKSQEMSRKFGVGSALSLIDQLDLSLSATQLGITVASLLLGWQGEQILAGIFYKIFLTFSPDYAFFLSHGVATTLALLIVTFLHVVIGELAAKSLAIRFPEETFRYLAPLMLLITNLCRPLIFILNESANLFLKIFGIKAVVESDRVHSSGELTMLISQSTQHGVLDKSEEEMLKGIFGFSETVAREVMTPRTDLVTIPYSSSFEESVSIVTKSGLSRFPVVGEMVDDVKGILLSRDLLSYVPEYLNKGNKNFQISKLVRQPYFVPSTKPIDDLLNELKKRKVHMAIVLDEHGGVDGVVTLEDIIEEIVGDIFDESDNAEADFRIEESGDILVDGGILVADLNEKFKVFIPEGDYDTIAGFIFSSLGRLSQQGDRLEIDIQGTLYVNDIATEQKLNLPLFEEEQGENDHKKLTSLKIIVETVEGNRIETARLRKIYTNIEPSQKLNKDKEAEKEAVSGTE